jgi:hypothetical protein
MPAISFYFTVRRAEKLVDQHVRLGAHQIQSSRPNLFDPLTITGRHDGLRSHTVIREVESV